MRSAFALAGVLLAAGPAVAQQQPQRIPAPEGNIILQPREVIARKEAWVARPRFVQSRLTVKFMDEAKVRVGGAAVRSLTDTDLAEVVEIAREFGLTFSPVITLPASVVETVEQRAAFQSGHKQPDFQGIFWVDGPENRIEAAANALNALGMVEYAYFTVPAVDHGGPGSVSGATLAAAATGMGSEDPPNLTLFQRHHRTLYDVNGDNVIDVFGPDGDPSTLGDNEFWGGLDLETAYAWSDFLKDENLVRDTWDRQKNGARGATIRVGVIEGNAQVGSDHPHFDLMHVIVEPGQQLMPHEIEEKNHGTATLGIIAGRDHMDEGPDDEKGIVGMAPDCQPWFFPTVSVSQPGGRLFDAFISAYSFLQRGDVLSASIGFPPGPLVQNPTAALIIGAGSSIGITTVMSAGNDCYNHDEFGEWPAGDGGGIIVGASLPIIPSRPDLLPFTRLGFSNHYTEETAVRTHCQAWGALVTTTGYGDLYNGSNPNDREYHYTADFGGTSAAAPMIAATVASLQGLSKMFFGIPLMPTQIRSIIESGYLQEGIPQPCVSGTEDPPDGDPCFEFFYIQNCPGAPDPNPDPDLIGPHPRWDTTIGVPNADPLAQSLFTGSWFELGSPLTFAMVITGTHMFGNENSLKVAEGNVLLAQAKYQAAGRKDGTAPFPAPTYFFGAFYTDVGVIARTLHPNTVASINVTVQVQVTGASFPIIGVEAYNRQFGRWNLIGTTPTGAGSFPVNFPNQYVDLSTGEVMVRCWVLAAGFGSGRFIAAYDLIDVDILSGGFGGGGDPF